MYTHSHFIRQCNGISYGIARCEQTFSWGFDYISQMAAIRRPKGGADRHQGSHFFLLTKFTDFSSIFFIFPWLLLNNILMAFIQNLFFSVWYLLTIG